MELIPSNALCQIEIQVSDMQASLKFYENVFGWKAAPAELQEYVVMQVPEGSPYGISLVPGVKSSTSAKSRMTLYFKLESKGNADAILSKIPENKGELIFGPKELPGYGTIWQFSDPDGQRFGLFAPF